MRLSIIARHVGTRLELDAGKLFFQDSIALQVLCRPASPLLSFLIALLCHQTASGNVNTCELPSFFFFVCVEMWATYSNAPLLTVALFRVDFLQLRPWLATLPAVSNSRMAISFNGMAQSSRTTILAAIFPPQKRRVAKISRSGNPNIPQADHFPP